VDQIIAEDYLRHVDVDTALVLDQALGIFPVPDADRDAYEGSDDDEFGREAA
jgi:hypothetical protein